MGMLSFSCFAAVGKVEPMRAAAEVERREEGSNQCCFLFTLLDPSELSIYD